MDNYTGMIIKRKDGTFDVTGDVDVFGYWLIKNVDTEIWVHERYLRQVYNNQIDGHTMMIKG